MLQEEEDDYQQFVVAFLAPVKHFKVGERQERDVAVNRHDRHAIQKQSPVPDPRYFRRHISLVKLLPSLI